MNDYIYLEEEVERREWQNPEAILSEIGLKPGFTFIDLGCGAGFFTLPAARIVGDGGKVYGVDIDRDAKRRLEAKAAKEGVRNLSLTVGKAEETVVCEACADIVFFGIVLHDFEDPAKVLLNAKKMIKATGHLVNLDWKKEPMTIGPPPRIRFAEEDAVRLIEDAGFKLERVKESGAYQYLIMGKP